MFDTDIFVVVDDDDDVVPKQYSNREESYAKQR